MQPGRSKRIDEIFQAALELEPSLRAAFLEEVSKEDATILGEVQHRISIHEKNSTFFENTEADPITELIERKNDYRSSISHYKILKKIRSGGMGEVYLAEDTRLNRKVAVKLLASQFTKDRDRVKRFEREARAASALNHPNILTVYDIGQIYSSSFLVSEYIEGETLRQRMWKSRMPLTEILSVGVQMAEALQAAHQAGIIHRDIKPENIMIRHDDYIKVLDFGLAKLTGPTRPMVIPDAEDPTSSETQPGIVLGTVRYMSPEQAQGFKVDARSDIFSVGVVLYEMITGNSPFDGATSSDLVKSIIEKQPPSLRMFGDFPEEVEWIINKALAKNLEERYQTARDLLNDLKRVRKQLEIKEELRRSDPNAYQVPQTLKSQFEPSTSKKLKIGLLIAFCMLIILLFLILFVYFLN